MGAFTRSAAKVSNGIRRPNCSSLRSIVSGRTTVVDIYRMLETQVFRVRVECLLGPRTAIGSRIRNGTTSEREGGLSEPYRFNSGAGLPSSAAPGRARDHRHRRRAGY